MIMYFRNPAHFGDAPPINVPINAPPPLFPGIRAKMPHLYQLALDANLAVGKLSWFKDLYFPLALATSTARLALDRSDQVIVIPDQAGTERLLGPKLAEAALKQSGKSVIKELVGEDFARVLGILDFLWKLKTALTLDDGRRLVSEQNRSRADEAYRFKLRFFIRLWIAQNAPTADPVILASKIEDAFWMYRKALGELFKYQEIEKNLAAGLPPYQRSAPTMSPAP
jgi:hypothetical protein